MKDDKRLKRKVRNSYIVSTVSITLVLFLLGSVGYLMVAAMKVADTLQESIAVTVELENGLSDEQKDAVNRQLTAEDLVATIAYVGKEEKIEDAEFRKMLASEFEEIPRQQHHAGHPGRTGSLAAVRAFGLRAQRSRPRTADDRRGGQGRHHPRRDDCRGHRNLGAFHDPRAEQIHQHEVEQDIPLLNEKSQ